MLGRMMPVEVRERPISPEELAELEAAAAEQIGRSRQEVWRRVRELAVSWLAIGPVLAAVWWLVLRHGRFVGFAVLMTAAALLVSGIAAVRGLGEARRGLRHIESFWARTRMEALAEGTQVMEVTVLEAVIVEDWAWLLRLDERTWLWLQSVEGPRGGRAAARDVRWRCGWRVWLDVSGPAVPVRAALEDLRLPDGHPLFDLAAPALFEADDPVQALQEGPAGWTVLG
jgi:hypothetical protein